jgi:hypothetical protein
MRYARSVTRSTRWALVGAGIVVVVAAAKKKRRQDRYLSPGVYVEEVPAASKPIEGVGTSTAAFVGLAPGRPVNTPTR